MINFIIGENASGKTLKFKEILDKILIVLGLYDTLQNLTSINTNITTIKWTFNCK